MKRSSSNLFVVLACSIVTFTHAQVSLPVHPCATMYVDSLLRIQYPSMGSYNYSQTDSSATPLQLSVQTTGIITIPVVFHIIHDGEPVGVERNISQAQINSQITVLNEDFRRMANTPGWNTLPAGADVEIEFCAAIVDPDGNYLAEPGIDRHDGDEFPNMFPPYDVTMFGQRIKPPTIWDTDRYFNIWVAEISDWGGYSQFPDSSGLPGLDDVGGPADQDGFVVHYKFCGRYPDNPFESDLNMGRVATHEMGHSLGLRHMWGDANGCTGSDYCEDTPLADQPGDYHANVNCEHPFDCENFRMIENYMDYARDECHSAYTQDQKSRMRHVMNVCPRRRTLPFSNVCHAGPNCDAVTFSPASITENASVQFAPPFSGGYATTYQWYFEGGSPSSSTDANPVVSYSSYGVYSATLTITNQFGSCTTVKDNFVPVYPVNPCDTLHFPLAGNETVYTAPGGYVCGWNSDQDQSKAEFFLSAAPYGGITGAIVRVANVIDNGNNASVLFRVWTDDGVNGSPGTVISERVVLLSALEAAVPVGGDYKILFTDPVPANENFYVGFTMINFGTGDSFGIASNTDGDSDPALAWEQAAENMGGAWKAISDSRQLDISMKIFPLVTLNPAHAEIQVPTYGCADSHVQFSAGTEQAVSFNWTFPGGNPSTSTSQNPQVMYAQPGMHSVYLSVIGPACNTLDRDSVRIMIHGNPSMLITTEGPACFGYNDAQAMIQITEDGLDTSDVDPNDPIGSEVTIYTAVVGGNVAYFGDSILLPWSNAVWGLSAGNYAAVAVNAYGCASELNFTIGQPDEITVTTTSTSNTCSTAPNGTATANVTGGTQPYSFSWNDWRHQTTVSATGLTNGVYEVVVIDSNGCASVQTASVALGVPFCIRTNVNRMISPDGDGENDTWQIDGIADTPDAVVKIYDALGREVFFSVGYSSAWDGTMNGQLLPDGTYSYLISSGESTVTGVLMLVR
jgi:gliding motility-associated-like protein